MGFGSPAREHAEKASAFEDSFSWHVKEAYKMLDKENCNEALRNLIAAEHSRGALLCHRGKRFRAQEARNLVNVINNLRVLVVKCFERGCR